MNVAFAVTLFAIIIFQIAVTFYVMENFEKDTGKKVTFLDQAVLAVIQLALMAVMALVTMSFWPKFILFTLNSILIGIILAGMAKTMSGDFMKASIVAAAAIFIAFFVAALVTFYSGLRLGPMFGTALLGALILLIVGSVVQLIFKAYSKGVKALFAMGLFLFSLFVVYDTQTILSRDYRGDVIEAAMDYFWDFINIFLNLVGLRR